jgi:hypothetical protein
MEHDTRAEEMGETPVKVSLVALNFSDPTAEFWDGVSLGLYALRGHAYRSPEVRERATIEIRDLPLTQRHMGVEDLLDADTEVLGISCASWSVPWAERLAREARARHPALWIWYGGDCAPRLLDRNALSWTPRDVVFPGAAGFIEDSFRQLLEQYVAHRTLDPDVLQATPGIVWWAKPDRRISNPLPPYRPLSEVASPYLEGEMPIDPQHDIFWPRTSQGCISRCRYCSYSRDEGIHHCIDVAPIARLGAEIDVALRGGCRHVQTLSVGLNYNEPHLRALLSLPLDRFESVRTIHSLARFNRDQANLFLGKAPGLFRLSFGVQSLSRKACLTARRRHLSIEHIRERLAPLRGHSEVDLDLIFPLPGETLASFQRGVEALLDLGFGKVFVNQMTIGSELAFGREPQRWGLEIEDIGEMLFATACDGFPRRDLERAQEWLRTLSGVSIADSRSWLRLRKRTDPARPPEGCSVSAGGAGPDGGKAPSPQPVPSAPLAQEDRPGTLRILLEDRLDHVAASEFYVGRAEEGDRFLARANHTGLWYKTCPSATVREEVAALLLEVARGIDDPPDRQNVARWTRALLDAFASNPLSTHLTLTVEVR